MTETLDSYLAAFARGDAICGAVADVVARIAAGAIALADLTAQGTLAGPMAAVLRRSAGGDEQKALDLRAHEIFLDALQGAPVAALASEEADEAIALTKGAPLAVALDPLDGSKNIDVNAGIGSIFAILPRGDLPWPRMFLQPGSALLGAGFTLHGPQTTLVLTLGTGVNVFTLDRARGAFVLTHANVRLPMGVREYAINAANYRHWDAAIRLYVDDLVAGVDGPRGADFNMRWLGCAVAEAYRVLLRGGVYLYPGDCPDGDAPRTAAADLRGEPAGLHHGAGGRCGDRWRGAHPGRDAACAAPAHAAGLWRARQGGAHRRLLFGCHARG